MVSMTLTLGSRDHQERLRRSVNRRSVEMASPHTLARRAASQLNRGQLERDPQKRHRRLFGLPKAASKLT